MHTFKEPHKPVSFQIKFDFIAWLQEEHISEVLASGPPTGLPWYLGSCHNTAVLANEKQSPAASYHWESFSHLESYRCFVSSDRMSPYPFLLSSSQEKRKHFNPLNKSLDGDISLSLSFLIPTLITSIYFLLFFKPDCLIYHM